MTKTTIRAEFVSPDKGHEASQPKIPMVGCGSLVVTCKDGLREAITVCTYYASRGDGMQPVRACIWIRPTQSGADWRSGRGSAGGCGYHKESAAIADAVSAAGVRLYGNPYPRHGEPVDMKKPIHFGGTGSSAYADIMMAIARAAGYRGRMVWVSHSL